MSSQLTVDQVANRLSNFPLDRYLYIGSFMRSVAWAAGTYVLVELLRHPKKYWPRLLPWMVSLLATMVTLMTWGRGVLLTNSRANVWDSVLPTLMGIAEVCLFAILAPQSTEDSPDFGSIRQGPLPNQNSLRWSLDNNFRAWHLWFFILGIHALLAVFLVGNRIANTLILSDFDPQLYSLAGEYMQWMRDDKFGATMGTFASIISAGLMVLFVHLSKSTEKKGVRTLCMVLYVGLFIPPICLFRNVILDAERQRQRADEVVFALEKKSAESPRDEVSTGTKSSP